MDGRDLNLGPQACVGGTSLTEACPQPLDLKHVDSKSYCVLPVLLEAECSSWSFYLEVITKLLMSLLGTETSALDALKSPNAQFQLRSSNTTHCKHPTPPHVLGSQWSRWKCSVNECVSSFPFLPPFPSAHCHFNRTITRAILFIRHSSSPFNFQL